MKRTIGIKKLLQRIAICSLFFSCFSLTSFAQFYHYYKLGTENTSDSQDTFHLFLTQELDGSFTARIRYRRQEIDQLAEVRYTDTLSVLNDSSKTRWMLPESSPSFLSGSVDHQFTTIKFSCIEKLDSTGLPYFEPAVFQSLSSLNRWQNLRIEDQLSFECNDALNHKDLILKFYSQGEPFVEYLMSPTFRGLSSSQKKAKIHLILVANTLDQIIGKSSQKDLEKMNDLFDQISKDTGLGLHKVIISGSDFSKSNVERAIRSLRVKNSDIIFFYFSGHGFRFPFDTSKFPRMSLRTSRLLVLEDHNLGEEEVYETLLKKKANVSIVLSDCCNERLESSSSIGLSLLRPRSNGGGVNVNFNHFNKLFFPPQKVSVLVGSAEKNQLSVGNPSLGGFYTNFFHANLMKSLYAQDGPSSWSQIVQAAKVSTTKQARTAICGDGRCVQRAELMVLPPMR